MYPLRARIDAQSIEDVYHISLLPSQALQEICQDRRQHRRLCSLSHLPESYLTLPLLDHLLAWVSSPKFLKWNLSYVPTVPFHQCT